MNAMSARAERIARDVEHTIFTSDARMGESSVTDNDVRWLVGEHRRQAAIIVKLGAALVRAASDGCMQPRKRPTCLEQKKTNPNYGLCAACVAEEALESTS